MKITTSAGRITLAVIAGGTLAVAAASAANAADVSPRTNHHSTPSPSSHPNQDPPSVNSTEATAKARDVGVAASPCWFASGHWWCYNVSGAPVYNSDYSVAGYMYSNPSWFICRSDAGGYVGGSHPYRWEWTQADNGAWGWMKDSAIYSETNPLPVC
jgi:hypothetical protein